MLPCTNSVHDSFCLRTLGKKSVSVVEGGVACARNWSEEITIKKFFPVLRVNVEIVMRNH